MHTRNRHKASDELNARIHHLIVHDGFLEWRRRTAGMAPVSSGPAPVAKRATAKPPRVYPMSPCAHPDCERLVYVVRHRTGKCAIHAQQRTRRRRRHAMA